MEAAALLGLGTAPADVTAQAMIKAAISKLAEQKRLELEERVGSWGPMDQERLDRLQRLEASSTLLSLRPYLIRAIAKNEFTGGFWVSVCDDTIFVIHGSLGHSIPPSIRLPIVFLNSAPDHVYVGWNMAQ